MYVVIVCGHCAGASQVDEGELGKLVQCPLCGQTTVARTHEAVLPVAKPVEPPAFTPPPVPTPPPNEPEVLSLDDAPQLPPKPPPAPRAKRSPVRTAVYTGLSLLATLILMGLIYGAFRYGHPDIPDSAWETFTPPGGRCTIEMPGEPESEDVPAEGYAVLGGKRFTVKRWFERVEVGFGWIDLNADQLFEKHFDTVVFDFLHREMKRLGGELGGEHTMNFVVKGRKWEARRYQGDTPKGKAVVQVYFDADPARLEHHEVTQKEPRRMLIYAPTATGAGLWLPYDYTVEIRKRVFAPGQKLRLYFATARGKKLTANTPWVGKFFNSFVPE